ncbi:MAG: UDP-glucose/GDP-mannose dehydrogenase family protein [Gemmatales bacterium]|nr:UDP-glucose/GDP-mannose dehydrogenase family protein [Gemmatales bacterium]MDW8385452.1 UDP-glucose/GDP-mannose dehydrogenase family protein [Gemmatales bacterium]
MRIVVIGTGYVGLVTGTCLAESGNEVTCVDKDARKIAVLESGRLPIYEPGLLELVQRNRKEDRLHFSTTMSNALEKARIVFICVGTPQGDDGSADLGSVWAVADEIADYLNRGSSRTTPLLIVLKSTVPVGTNRRLQERLSQRTQNRFDVASNPEFLKEGSAVEDFMKPDRVVVGVRTRYAEQTLRDLYAPFLRTERPFLVMTPESAEMTKYVANAMLATKISFINEMANLCERMGADINDVRRGIGHDVRIGFQFLFPGPGWGGSCFPKDVQALIAMARANGMSARIVESVLAVNEAQKRVLGNKIRAFYGDSLKGKTLAVWGLSFKPRTDDIREAPSLVLIEDMLREGVALRVHDPEAMNNVRAIYGDRLIYCDRPYGALEGSDGLVIVTEWQEFRNPDFELMRRLMRQPVIFDGRNLYDPMAVREYGFTYFGIGRIVPEGPASRSSPD